MTDRDDKRARCPSCGRFVGRRNDAPHPSRPNGGGVDGLMTPEEEANIAAILARMAGDEAEVAAILAEMV